MVNDPKKPDVVVDEAHEAAREHDVFPGAIEVLSTADFEPLEDEEVSAALDSVSDSFERVRRPENYGEVYDFLERALSEESPELSVEVLRSELLDNFRGIFADYREGIGDMHVENSDMERWYREFFESPESALHLDYFLIETFLGEGVSAVLMLRPGLRSRVVHLLYVYAARYVGRIDLLSKRIKWASDCIENGGKYMGLHIIRNAVKSRADLKDSVGRRAALLRRAVMENEDGYFNPEARHRGQYPEIALLGTAGDEIVAADLSEDVSGDPWTSPALMRMLAHMVLVQKSARESIDKTDKGISVEFGLGMGDSGIMITQRNRVLVLGSLYDRIEKIQKLSKHELSSGNYLWNLDKPLDTPFDPENKRDRNSDKVIRLGELVTKFSLLVSSSSQSFSQLVGAYTQSQSTVNHALLSVDGMAAPSIEDDRSGPERMTDAFERFFLNMDYTSLKDNLSRYGIDLSMEGSDKEVLVRLMKIMAMVPGRLYDVEHAEESREVDCAAVMGFIDLPDEPDFDDPEACEMYAQLVDAALDPIEEICDQYDITQVYVDSSGVIILSAGILGTSPLDVHDRMARATKQLLDGGYMSAASQTYGPTHHGLLGGGVNTSGLPFDLSARYLKILKNFKNNQDHKDDYSKPHESILTYEAGHDVYSRSQAKYCLDAETYRRLKFEGYKVEVIASKLQKVRGVEDLGLQKFYLCSEIIPDAEEVVLLGGEDEFGSASAHIDALRVGNAGVGQFTINAIPGSGVEKFRHAMRRRAVKRGREGTDERAVRVLGEGHIPHISRSYGLLRYVLGEIFSDGETFEQFLNHSGLFPDKREVLMLLYGAIMDDQGAANASSLKPLISEFFPKIIQRFSATNPLMIFVNQWDSLDPDSREVFEVFSGMTSEQSAEGALRLVVTKMQFSAGASSVLKSRMTHQDGGGIPVISGASLAPLEEGYDEFDLDLRSETVALLGWNSEQAFDWLKKALNVSMVGEDIRDFYVQRFGPVGWPPRMIYELTQILQEEGCLSEESSSFVKLPSEALSALDDGDSWDVKIGRPIVTSRLSQVPSHDRARSILEVACFLGDPDDAIPESLLRAAITPTMPDRTFDAAKTLLSDLDLMYFMDGNAYFVQGYVPRAARKIFAGNAKVEAANYERILDVLIDLSRQDPSSVSPELLMEQARRVPGGMVMVAPMVVNTLESMAKKDPVNADILLQRFLDYEVKGLYKGPRRPFLKDAAESYVRAHYSLARVSSDLGRKFDVSEESFNKGDELLDRWGHGIPQLLRTRLQVKGYVERGEVAYFAQKNDTVLKTIASLMGVSESVDRFTIDLFKLRIGLRRASLKSVEENFLEARRLAEDTFLRFKTLCDVQNEGEVNVELIKMGLLIDAFLSITLVLDEVKDKKKGGRLRSLTSDEVSEVERVLALVSRYIGRDSDFDIDQKASVGYILAQGATLIRDFDLALPSLQSLLEEASERGRIDVFKDLEQRIFLLAGEKAEYFHSTGNKEKALPALDFFKSRIERMRSLAVPGSMHLLYTDYNALEYYKMMIDFEDDYDRKRALFLEMEKLRHTLSKDNYAEELLKRLGPYFNVLDAWMREQSDTLKAAH